MNYLAGVGTWTVSRKRVRVVVCPDGLELVQPESRESPTMTRRLKSGQYRPYSRKIDPKTKRRRNLGTFDTRAAAEKHERAVHSSSAGAKRETQPALHLFRF